MAVIVDMDRNHRQYNNWAKKEYEKFLVDYNIETGRIIAEMYRELALGRESKIREALIAEGWTPPKEKGNGAE